MVLSLILSLVLSGARGGVPTSPVHVLSGGGGGGTLVPSRSFLIRSCLGRGYLQSRPTGYYYPWTGQGVPQPPPPNSTGVPLPPWRVEWVTPPPPPQPPRWTGNTAGGMPLAVTQEDFLVFNLIADSSQNSTAVTHCVVFTEDQKGDSPMTATDFSCDIHHVCSNAVAQVKVTLKFHVFLAISFFSRTFS